VTGRRRAGGAALAGRAALAALVVATLLGGLAGAAAASRNDDLAASLRDLLARGAEDSAGVVVRDHLARAPDLLSAMLRASIRADADAAASPDERRAWRDAIDAFARLARREGAEPVVDSVDAIARAWGPAERAGKARAESLFVAGYAAIVGRRLDDARAALDAALVEYRRISDRYREGYIELNLALVERERGAPGDARARLDAASAAFVRIGDRRGEAWALDHAATLVAGRGAYAEAESLLARALALARAVRDGEREAEITSNRGSVRLARGRFRDAGADFQAAVDLGRRLGNARLAAAALQNLGIIQEMLGETRAARGTFETCLALARERGDAVLASHAASNLANVLFDLGEAASAESLHRAALAEDAAAGDASALAADFENLARLLVSSGRYSAAEETIATAIHLCEERSLPRERIYLLLARARLLREVNEPHAAARALEEAAAAAGAIGDRSAEGQAATRLGEIATLLGEPREASRHFAAAAAAHRETGEALRLLETENLRACALLESGDLPAARAAADSALALATRLGAITEGARTSWVLARIAATDGRLADAEALLDRAARRLPARFQQDLAWQIEFARADVAERSGDVEDAVRSLLSGIAIVEDVRGGVLAHRHRARYVEDKESLYRTCVSLLLSLGRAEEAFAIAERGRARAFLDILAGGGRDLEGADSPVEAPDARAARRRVETLLSRWDELGDDGVSAEEEDAAGALAGLLDEAYGEYERAALPLLRAARAGSAATADVASIRRALSPDEALLDFFFARDGLVLFVVTRDGLRAYRLGTARAALADQVRIARALLEDPTSPRDRVDRLLAGLGDVLLGPPLADGALEGARLLLVVPHGPLHWVPFAALAPPRPGENPPPRVVDRFDTAILPSASLLLLDRAPSASRDSRASAASRASGTPPAPSGPLLVLGGSARPGRPALPFAEEEARRIAKGAERHGEVVLLAGSRADETAWKRACARAGRIHVAAHGRASRGNPLFSALAMLPGSADDGLLEVHEVLRLRLGADLAVLSGCETGRASGYAGELPPGEEMIGLAPSFLAAGVPAVIATLWPVADRAAADFMVEVHGNLLGLDPARALSRAQRRWAKGENARSHPFYWASPVLFGWPDGG